MRGTLLGLGASLIALASASGLPVDRPLEPPVETPDAGADASPREDAPAAPACVTDADCSDGVLCTLDRCDASTRQCTHVPDDALCDDGSTCNGAETCDAERGCLPGDPIDCYDGLDCTLDFCMEPEGRCMSVPISPDCDDGSRSAPAPEPGE